MRHALAFVLVGLWSTPAVFAGEPLLRWTLKADSNLYAPPLVVDVCPSPGCETILCDSEVRTVRCVDAQGHALWEYRGEWKKRLTSAASLSQRLGAGRALLVIGNADGILCCIDAKNGAEVWRRQVGTLEWGAAIWADLDGDGIDEVIAGTQSDGILALTDEGEELWRCARTDERPTLNVTCPVGAADIDGDGRAEVFVVDQWGPICLSSEGEVRWERQTGDEFLSAPVVADADADGRPELYCAGRDAKAVFSFDARDGAVRWRFGMVGGSDVYPGSSIAVGDVDGNGEDEIIVGDAEGHIYCLTPAGTERWRYVTEKPTHGAPSIGDVDGDGEVEVVIASGDHHLYCLNHHGDLEWRYAADLRLIYPATIADVDKDGRTDILFCGSDRTLRCLSLGGRYDESLLPWPSRRFDSAQSGSCFNGRDAATRSVSSVESLFEFGDFELGRGMENPAAQPPTLVERRESLPRGWLLESGNGGQVALTTERKHGGARSAQVTASGGAAILSTEVIAVPPTLRSVDATAWVHSVGASESNGKAGAAKAGAYVRWSGTKGELKQDKLSGAGSEWTALELEGATPPAGARWLQLVCVTEAAEGGTATAWWDDVRLMGTFNRRPELRALVNQVGYDVGAPKEFTAQSNFRASAASFAVIDESENVVFEGELISKSRIVGAHGHDWGYEYWRGDFSEFDEPGSYRVRIILDGLTDTSWPFQIASDVLWSGTSQLAYRFFYYQRCGMAIPGFHGACHLDDAASPDGKEQFELHGGWHDAGDYNTYHNAPYVWGLVRAYTVQQEAFDLQDADSNGVSDFLDEIVWGGDHSRRMVAPDGSAYGHLTSGYGFWGPPELETDNIPNTGDERRVRGESAIGHDSANHCAAAARIARFVDDKAPYVEAADRALRWALKQGKRGPLQLSAAVDLFVSTGNEEYAALAKELLPDAGWDLADVIEAYDETFGTDHSEALRAHFTKRADAILALADNPFGVYTYGPAERPNFFGAPGPDGQGGWHVGNSSHVLEAANVVAIAYRYDPEPRYLRFVYDQFNWILGNNPYDLCLMEGVGSANPPTYHHRYTFAGVPRGAVPGSVVNGITWRGVGDDRPYFDLRGLDIPDFEPNEVWLPHNTAYLNALANLGETQSSERQARRSGLRLEFRLSGFVSN